MESARAKDTAGKVKTVIWEATGEGILPGQFQRFTFVAKNPDKEQKIAWDAYQQYKDGEIVEWTGDEKLKNRIHLLQLQRYFINRRTW